ncbi:flagella synthesis protein FlgN [Nitrincola alkalilacustris]|uniref:flagella synthesis protein FlgN n=1 Tax=Nitrincola alkalilacustris TaxID=1571224 RepID=UPI00124EF4BB|nr:flagellar protein FlgN [Nitrincola alkalilacustris]
MSDKLTQEFFALVRQGILLFEQLKLQLEAERSAIEARDLDQLTNATGLKQTLLEQIELNIKERNDTLIQLGLTPSEDGVKKLLSQLPEKPAQLLESEWNRLTDSLHEVRESNQRNEQIVNRSKRNLDQLIALLQGQSGKGVLYDNRGEKGNYSPQSRIGKA